MSRRPEHPFLPRGQRRGVGSPRLILAAAPYPAGAEPRRHADPRDTSGEGERARLSLPTVLSGDGGGGLSETVFLVPLCFPNQRDVINYPLRALPEGCEPEQPVPAVLPSAHPRCSRARRGCPRSREQSYKPCCTRAGRLPWMNPFKLKPSLFLYPYIKNTPPTPQSLFSIRQIHVFDASVTLVRQSHFIRLH